MNDQSTSMLHNQLNLLDSTLEHVLSKVFNDTEAKKYIDLFHVDVESLKKNGIDIG